MSYHLGLCMADGGPYQMPPNLKLGFQPTALKINLEKQYL